MIQLHGIHQTYRGAQGPVQALRGVDLHVRLGEVFGVIGRSGAGKSSLVRTINLLNRPTGEKAKLQYAAQFPKLSLFTIDQAFGGWANVSKAHFGDNGFFDQIYAKK